MKRSASAAAALLGVAFVLQMWTPDASADGMNEPPPADTAAPEDTAAAPEPAVTEPAPVEATAEAAPAEVVAEAPAEEAPVEEAPVEEAPVEEAASEDAGEPFYLYAGVDYAKVTLSISDEAREAQFGGRNPRSDFYRLRLGTRIFGAVGLEAQYGIADSKDDEDDKFETAAYYGAFIVPTGTLFDLFEIAVPVGYSVFKAEKGNATTELDGVSYGLNIEVPIPLGGDWLPELRLGGGGLVYQAHDDTRVYGYHFGVRADFKL